MPTSFRVFLLFSLATLLLCSYRLEKTFSIQEYFNSLENWRPIYFNHDKHTSYKIINSGDYSYMKSESKATATAMVYKGEFDVYTTPIIEWRWQVNNIIKNATLNSKKGDDFALAVYILFKYDYDNMSYFEKMSYNTKKTLFGGEEPPHSTLRFVWSTYSDGSKKVYVTPYQDSGRNYLTQIGSSNCGKWITEKENIIDIYKKAFGTNPPKKATIGFMNDSDNTGESAVSYLDYIEIYAE